VPFAGKPRSYGRSRSEWVGAGILKRQKKALPSGQRFYQSVVCLSFQHIPQRFEFGLAEQTSRVTIEDHPAWVGFPDLSRSIALQPLRQNLKRLAIYCGSPLADPIHFQRSLPVCKRLTYPRFMTEHRSSTGLGLTSREIQELCQGPAIASFRIQKNPQSIRAAGLPGDAGLDPCNRPSIRRHGLLQQHSNLVRRRLLLGKAMDISAPQ